MPWRQISCFILLAGMACADSWTNAASHSIEADLVGRKGNVLTMKRTDGSMFTISSKALSEASRITANRKCPTVPKLTYKEVVAQRQQQRIKMLEKRKAHRSVGGQRSKTSGDIGHLESTAANGSSTLTPRTTGSTRSGLRGKGN